MVRRDWLDRYVREQCALAQARGLKTRRVQHLPHGIDLPVQVVIHNSVHGQLDRGHLHCGKPCEQIAHPAIEPTLTHALSQHGQVGPARPQSDGRRG